MMPRNVFGDFPRALGVPCDAAMIQSFADEVMLAIERNRPHGSACAFAAMR